MQLADKQQLPPLQHAKLIKNQGMLACSIPFVYFTNSLPVQVVELVLPCAGFQVASAAVCPCRACSTSAACSCMQTTSLIQPYWLVSCDATVSGQQCTCAYTWHVAIAYMLGKVVRFLHHSGLALLVNVAKPQPCVEKVLLFLSCTYECCLCAASSCTGNNSIRRCSSKRASGMCWWATAVLAMCCQVPLLLSYPYSVLVHDVAAAGKRVVVVGNGRSALDCASMAAASQQATRVTWLFRQVRLALASK